MRRFLSLVSLVFAGFLATPALAVDVLYGTVATGSSLAVPNGSYISIQCPVAAYAMVGVSGGSYTSSDAVYLAANYFYDPRGKTTTRLRYVFAFQDAGATTCKVFIAVGEGQ